MKTLLSALLLGPLLSGSFNLMAQSWVNGGNALTANGSLGTTTNFSVIFKTVNKEQGRITNGGLWGIGTSSPDSRLTINCTPDQVPFRVEVNGSTKMFVHSGGGVSIGSSTTPPANTLFVAGNVGIGTSAPENKLHVFKGSAGSITGHADAPVIVENSTNSYINILAPDVNETGILFGRPNGGNAEGQIIYNAAATPGTFQFRPNTFFNPSSVFLGPRGQLGVGTESLFYKAEILINDLGGDDGLALANTSGDLWEIFPIEGNGMPGTIGGLDLLYQTSIKGEFFRTNGVYASISDRRLKTNIKPMAPMMGKIMQLKPSTYQFKNTTDKQEYNGFIAQDVMELFPSLVMHNIDTARKIDVYTMDYSGFGILAIKGIQELQPIVVEEKEKLATLENAYKLKVATLEDRMDKLRAAIEAIITNKNGNISNSISKATLEQNKPNPFNNTTTIRYRIPYGSKGQINIYDQEGKIIKTLNTNESGQNELSGHDLAAGTYIYTLLIDGKVVLSKQMLIIR